MKERGGGIKKLICPLLSREQNKKQNFIVMNFCCSMYRYNYLTSGFFFFFLTNAGVFYLRFPSFFPLPSCTHNNKIAVFCNKNENENMKPCTNFIITMGHSGTFCILIGGATRIFHGVAYPKDINVNFNRNDSCKFEVFFKNVKFFPSMFLYNDVNVM